MSDTPGVVVEAHDLSIEYRSDAASPRHLAVKGVSFDLLDGEVLGVIGDSGSGKSALGATIAGLAGSRHEKAPEICGGTLSVLGTEVRGIGRRARSRLVTDVGFLPQDGGVQLNPRLTVAENVAEPIYLRDRHFDASLAGRAVAVLIDDVHLPLSMLQKQPHELSRGQLQRVALARALVLDPLILVADEPISGVDLTVRRSVLGVIRRIQTEREGTGRSLSAVVISSELQVVREVADRIAVLHDGLIVGIGELGELLATPEHPYVRALARAATSGTVG